MHSVATDLAATDARVLWELGFRGTARPGALAAIIGVGAPAVSKAVKRLAAANLVIVTADPDDGRACELTLSREGRSVARRLYAVGDDMIRELTADWDEEDIRIMTALTARLARSAHAYMDGLERRRTRGTTDA